MIKWVKTFYETDLYLLQEDINEWIEENVDKIEIIDIKFSSIGEVKNIEYNKETGDSLPEGNILYSTLIIYSEKVFKYSNSGIPTNSLTFDSVILLSPSAIHLSKILYASLIAPSDILEIKFIAFSSIFIPILSEHFFKVFDIFSIDIRLKSNL